MQKQLPHIQSLITITYTVYHNIHNRSPTPPSNEPCRPKKKKSHATELFSRILFPPLNIILRTFCDGTAFSYRQITSRFHRDAHTGAIHENNFGNVPIMSPTRESHPAGRTDRTLFFRYTAQHSSLCFHFQAPEARTGLMMMRPPLPPPQKQNR